MANPFVNFLFPATGQTTGRSMPARLAEVKNVMDFGALNDGTNAAATTAAVQAAVDVGASTGSHGTIYFPPGAYSITTPGIRFNHVGDTSIRFVGEGKASLITGNLAGFVFERSANPAPSSLDTGPIVFEHLAIVNNSSSVSAGCIRVGSVRCVVVRNCTLSAAQGAWFCGETYDASEGCLIENCPITGTNGVTNRLCNAVVIGGSGAVNACDITGNDGCAIRIFGKGASVRDTRMEVNRWAIRVGLFPDNSADTTCGNFTWFGGSTESNSLTLDMQYCTNFLLAGTGAGGGAARWLSPAVAGPLTITGLTSGATAAINASGIDQFGNFTVTSKTGTWVAAEGFSGTGVPLGAHLGSTITGAGTFFAQQYPQYNTYIGPNVSNGVFAGYAAGSQAYAESIYISDTTNRGGLVFLSVSSVSSATALGSEWRLPTTAHTAEFLNCSTSSHGSPSAQPVPVYLFSGLPSGANVREGDEYDISNAHTTNGLWGETVSSSGGVTVGHARIRYNGTNWTLVGK